LNYVAHSTRLDVAFAVNQLSRATHFATHRHLVAAEHVVSYLVGTADWGLHYSKACGITLECYADADYHVTSDRKSMTGFVLKVAGGPVFWTSRKQDSVTSSTTDSEGVALVAAVQHVEFARDMLEELGCIQMQPTPVFSDNSAAVALCVDALAHKKSVNLTRLFAYARERTKYGMIAPVLVRTWEQAADFLTKSLPFEVFAACRYLCGMVQVPSP
jgi:hypothetical protein